MHGLRLAGVFVVCGALLQGWGCSDSDPGGAEAVDAGKSGAAAGRGGAAAGGQGQSPGGSTSRGGSTGPEVAGASDGGEPPLPSTGGRESSGGTSAGGNTSAGAADTSGGTPAEGGSSNPSGGGDASAGSAGEGPSNGGSVCEGDYQINALDAYADFVALKCRVVTGNLIIAIVDGLEELAGLETLEEVQGSLSIGNNPDLGSLVGAGNLRRVGTLNLVANPRLASLIGLDRLEHADLAYFTSMTGLVDFTGLEALKEIPRGIIIDEAAALQSFSGLSGLQTLQGVVLSDSPSLVDFTGLETVKEISIVARNDASLKSVLGLENAATVHLQINDCPAFDDLTALSAVESIGMVVLHNTGLSDLSGLENASTVERLQLWDNTKLVDLGALSNLGDITSNLQIIENPVLTNLSGLDALRSVPSVTIHGNPELASLDLESLESPSSFLEITGNPKLPQCAVDALVTRMGATCPFYCDDNDSDGVCP